VILIILPSLKAFISGKCSGNR